MNVQAKFFSILISTAFTMQGFTLFAESEIRMRSLENRIQILEEQKQQPPDSITPHAGPRVQDGIDMSLSAAFIYWTARLDSLTYAKTGLGDATKKGQVYEVDWKWDPGFKVGIGWDFCHGGWDMQLQYTWFYTNVSDSTCADNLHPGFDIIRPVPDPLRTNFPMEKAHAHFDLHYQVGDLRLGRNYFIHQFLKLRPFVGIKGTWQKQDYNTFYESIPLLPPLIEALYNLTSRFDHRVWGLGMTAGLDTSWQFSKWFSLYGDFGVTGIWLHYHTERKDRYKSITDEKFLPITYQTVYLDGTINAIKPVLEFSIGLRAETHFKCSRLHALLQAGWESQIWINQTLLIDADNHYKRFDLNLHGLTARFRFGF
jgi:hypothetical protein